MLLTCTALRAKFPTIPSPSIPSRNHHQTTSSGIQDPPQQFLSLNSTLLVIRTTEEHLPTCHLSPVTCHLSSKRTSTLPIHFQGEATNKPSTTARRSKPSFLAPSTRSPLDQHPARHYHLAVLAAGRGHLKSPRLQFASSHHQNPIYRSIPIELAIIHRGCPLSSTYP